ncbi:MAG: hypothetical protein AAF405_00225 [Pseudomonadota bacterium]
MRYLLAALLLTFSSPAQAQVCGKAKAMLAAAEMSGFEATGYGEVPSHEIRMILMTHPDHRWAIVTVTMKDDRLCFVGAGNGWTLLESETAEEPAPEEFQ